MPTADRRLAPLQRISCVWAARPVAQEPKSRESDRVGGRPCHFASHGIDGRGHFGRLTHGDAPECGGVAAAECSGVRRSAFGGGRWSVCSGVRRSPTGCLQRRALECLQRSVMECNGVPVL
jgi:hypothetical protein